MNINRYNYEEYLMLYIDGELSPAEKQEVHTFLQQNPDVKEELELLQQTVLQPEHIVFEGKSSLYKKDSGISRSNYQEYFLLYIDNELSLLQKQAVETFVLQHPQLQEEFTVLKQTVLPEEKLVFANKEVLYRKEEKRRPVVISFNYRWASLAAAVMIGVVALIWIFRTDKANSTNGNGATAAKSIESKINTSTDAEHTQPSQTLPSSTNNEQSLAVEENKKQENIVTKENVAPFKQTTTKENIAALQENIQQREQQQTLAGITGNNNEVRLNTITLPTDNVSVSADDPYTSVAVTPSTTNDNNYTVKPTAANEELNTDENDKSLLVGSVQINKDKLRGFFRKAGRLFSNKVKPEDGKLQIANMEINSLK